MSEQNESLVRAAYEARTPGVDRHRVRPADDQNFLVLTLRQGRVVEMRACRDRAEARAVAGLG
jgi:hypothetical protein